MTAKEFVQERFPNARAERQVSGRIKGFQQVYWLIRNGRDTMYMASGKSESNAWVNAKASISEDDSKPS
jgi:hypothetical protein